MSSKFFNSKSAKLVLVVAICLVLVFFGPKKIFDPARAIFFRAAYPFQKIFYLASERTADFFSLLGSISGLKKENEKLIGENNKLAAQLADLASQKKENEELRNQLQLAPRKNYQLEAAFVIGQDSYGSSSWIMIDKGVKNGITADMPVIVSDGILIGKVSEVYKDSSKINLLTDVSSSVNAVDAETGAKGIVTGQYGLGLTLAMVEQKEVLNAGDNIMTSGLSGETPKGFLIGKIQQIKNTPDKLFQQALVIPKIPYSDLELVFVVKSSR